MTAMTDHMSKTAVAMWILGGEVVCILLAIVVVGWLLARATKRDRAKAEKEANQRRLRHHAATAPRDEDGRWV